MASVILKQLLPFHYQSRSTLHYFL